MFHAIRRYRLSNRRAGERLRSDNDVARGRFTDSLLCMKLNTQAGIILTYVRNTNESPMKFDRISVRFSDQFEGL